jgi:hypothetical protein
MTKWVALAGVVGWLVFGDWLAGLALAVLASIWVMLPADEGPPVFALAATMQWTSVCIGLFYVLVTGAGNPAASCADVHGAAPRVRRPHGVDRRHR